MARIDIPIREGYYEMYEKNNVQYIRGPGLNQSNLIVLHQERVQGDIYDITYCPEGKTSGEKIMRCHIIRR